MIVGPTGSLSYREGWARGSGQQSPWIGAIGCLLAPLIVCAVVRVRRNRARLDHIRGEDTNDLFHGGLSGNGAIEPVLP